MVPAWYQIAANVLAIVGVMLLMPHAEESGIVNAEPQS